MITSVAYLCARLLDMQTERRAAMKIQRAWRQWYKTHVLVKKEHAATLFQKLWRGVLGRRQARLARIQRDAGKIVKHALYCWSLRVRFLQMRKAAIKIQTWWRMVQQQRQFQKLREATRVIQAAMRSYLAACLAQKQQAAMRLQAWWRMVEARASFLEHKNAATKIARAVKTFQQRQLYLQQRQAIVKLQARIKGKLALEQYQKTQHAAVVLQAAFRGRRDRQLVNQIRAATKIQSWWRMILQRDAYQRAQKAVRTIEKAYEAFCARRRFLEMRDAATKIQAFARLVEAKKEYQCQRECVIRVQALVRARVAQTQHKKKVAAIVALQAAARGYLARRDMHRKSQAAVSSHTQQEERNFLQNLFQFFV